MTTQKELHAKKRHRYMVQGPVGSGKSRTLVLLAKRYAQQGKRVLYIDYRDLGGVDELLKLDEKTLEHIDYTNPHEYKDLLTLKMPDEVGLVIFDAMHHLRFRARKHIANRYIEQGEYTVNGKTTKIEDIETFDLGTLGGYGTGYGAANLREDDVIDKILNISCDVAISVIPDKPKEGSETFTELLMGNFDNILNLSFQDTEAGVREWYYTLYRWRGIETNDYSAQRNEGEIDPFAIIEATGGKPIRDYVVRYVEGDQDERTFLKGVDVEDVTTQLMVEHPEAKEVQVSE